MPSRQKQGDKRMAPRRNCFRLGYLTAAALVIVIVRYGILYDAHRGIDKENRPQSIQLPSRFPPFVDVSPAPSRKQLEAVKPLSSSESLWTTYGCNRPRPILMCKNDVPPNSTIDKVIELWRFRLADESDFSRHVLLNRRHDTCAIVGSSYNLMKREFGAEIDKHDLVARLNDPPVAGYEKHVGRRPSDVSIFNLNVARPKKTWGRGECAHVPHNRSLMVMCAFEWDSPGKKGIPLVTQTSNNECINASWVKYGLKTYTFSPAIVAASNEIRRYGRQQNNVTWDARTSSGLRSVLFMMHLCKEVHLYGFGSNKLGEPFKYYMKMKTEEFMRKKVHDFPREAEFLNDLANGVVNRTDFGLNGLGNVVVHQ